MENEMLQEFKGQFIELLNEHLGTYVFIGTPNIESPMWYQFTGEQDNNLVFRSSQKELGFRIPITNKFNLYEEDFTEVYNYFKRVKYEHIRDNWPTVFDEIKGTQKELILLFLRNSC